MRGFIVSQLWSNSSTSVLITHPISLIFLHTARMALVSTSDCFLEHSMSSTFFQGRDSTGDFTIYNLRGLRYHRNFGLKLSRNLSIFFKTEKRFIYRSIEASRN